MGLIAVQLIQSRLFLRSVSGKYDTEQMEAGGCTQEEIEWKEKATVKVEVVQVVVKRGCRKEKSC